MHKTIGLNGVTVEYEFERKKVRNINLRIRHDGTVFVSCGRYTSEEAVRRFLIEKADFILRNIAREKEKAVNACRPKDYSDGEKVKVFGDVCTIRVVRKTKGRARAELVYPEVILYVSDPADFAERQRVYEKFRKDTITSKIDEMCGYYGPMFEAKGVRMPGEIRIRKMTSKWGLCRPKSGILTFNSNLFEVPEEAVAYVVVHEYAHLIHADHSKRFYAEVASVMPDWKKRREVLNEY